MKAIIAAAIIGACIIIASILHGGIYIAANHWPLTINKWTGKIEQKTPHQKTFDPDEFLSEDPKK